MTKVASTRTLRETHDEGSDRDGIEVKTQCFSDDLQVLSHKVYSLHCNRTFAKNSKRTVPLYREMRIGIVSCASNITAYYFGASRGTLHGTIRASRSLGRHELGERQSGGPERPNRRGRLRSDLELQPGSHPRVRPHRLAEGHQRPRDAGHQIGRAACREEV